MYALLTCLDRPHRLAYVLGEILEMEGPEAAEVLGVSPAAFRKRLSRARAAIVGFTCAHCGLVAPAYACRCVRRLPRAEALGRVDPEAPLFARAETAAAFPDVLARVRELDEIRRTAALYRGANVAEPGPELLRAILAAVGP